MQDDQPVPGALDDSGWTWERAFALNRRDLVRTSFAGAVGSALSAAAGLSAAAAAAQPRSTAFPGSPAFPSPAPCPKALSVKDFGALGDGQADDTDAIQRALDVAPSNGGTICFPPGTYRITRTLKIHDDAKADDPLAPADPPHGRRGLRLVGSLTGASGHVNCTILWDGPDFPRECLPGAHDLPSMLELFSSDCAVEHLALHVGRGHVGAVIDVDNNFGNPKSKHPESPATCTNNTFHNVQIRRREGTKGTFCYGVRIAETALPNAESMVFTKCYILEAHQACVRIGGSDSGQSKDHTFLDCSFNGGSTGTPVGIEQRSGSFQTYSCAFENIKEEAIRLHAPHDNLLIVDSTAVNCARFIGAPLASTPGPWCVSIIGGTFVNDHPDFPVPGGEYIVFPYGGPLVILNCVFAMFGSPSFKIRAEVDARPPSPHAGTVLISIGNVFSVRPGESPYVNFPFLDQRRISFGNRSFFDSTNLDDEIVNVGDSANQGALSLGTVRAISATRTLARNLRGRVTLTGGTREAAVVFRDPFTHVPQPEPDADYFVTASVSEAPANPAPGSTHVYVTNKSSQGFTINLEAAPTTAVTVDWHLFR